MSLPCRLRVAALAVALTLFLPPASRTEGPSPGKVRILLLGDSTVIGSVCRREAPKADHLEDVIRKLLAAEADLPPAEVLNLGRDGEFVHGLLTGRYDKEVAKLPRVDFVLVRYGLNDHGRRKDFAANFHRDLRELIRRLKGDHPGCQVILETVIPYFGEQADKQINDLAGYHVIGDEAAKFLAPLIRERVKAATKP